MSKKALGRGIDALLRESEEEDLSSVKTLPIEVLSPSRFQPRREFPRESLEELAQSIKRKGILQPIIVEAEEAGRYMIVAGERRCRAAEIAGLSQVPVLVRRFTELEKIEIALIENLQREDLKPLEEASAYQALMEKAGLSQEEVAQRVGKKRSTIANALRLLKLPEEMSQALEEGRITPGHARAILSLRSGEDQNALYRHILDRALSVREAERLANRMGESGRPGSKPKTRESQSRNRPAELDQLEQRFIEHLGTKVQIRGTEQRGRIEIEYFSLDDLNRIWSMIGGGEEA